MGSNAEKKPWTNLQNLYKNLSKGIKSDNLMGSNREKFNIGTYPISHFKLYVICMLN